MVVAPLVTLRKYARVLDAQMARARLEAHGIETLLPDEQFATIDPLLIGAIGDVRLQVRAFDVGRARAILDEPPARDDAADELEEGPRCPKCDSIYCRPEWSGTQILLALALFGAPLAFMQKRLVCQRCDHAWAPAATKSRAGRPNAPYRLTTRSKKREGNPVFRLRRGRPATGLFVGAGIGVGTAIVAGPDVGAVAALVGPLAGWFLGRGVTSDVCSNPDCRVPLSVDAVECPGCRGTVEWVIHRAVDHFSAKAEWHRMPDPLAPMADPPPRKRARRPKRAR